MVTVGAHEVMVRVVVVKTVLVVICWDVVVVLLQGAEVMGGSVVAGPVVRTTLELETEVGTAVPELVGTAELELELEPVGTTEELLLELPVGTTEELELLLEPVGRAEELLLELPVGTAEELELLLEPVGTEELLLELPVGTPEELEEELLVV